MFVRTRVRRVRVFGVFVCSEACSENQSLDLKKNWPDPQVEDFSFKPQSVNVALFILCLPCSVVFEESCSENTCSIVFLCSCCVPVFELFSLLLARSVRKVCSGIGPICFRH